MELMGRKWITAKYTLSSPKMEFSLAKYQKWIVIEHGTPSNQTTVRNDTINEMQLLSQEDGYGRIQSWALNYFSDNEYIEETYNYWHGLRIIWVPYGQKLII